MHPHSRSTPSALASTLLFWGGYFVILLVASPLRTMVPPPFDDLAWGLASCVLLLPFTAVFVRWAGRRLGDIGLVLEPRSGLRFVMGLLVGLAVYGINIVLVSLLAGPLRFTPAEVVDPMAIVTTLAGILALAVMEELGFRGYPLRTLLPAIGGWQTQVVVAVAFALSHVVFGWSWGDVLFGVLPTAFLFGVAASGSGGLALPIGIHAGVNIARWAAGERGAMGLWLMEADEEALAGITALAPPLGVVVTVSITVLLWLWFRNGSRDAFEAALARVPDVEPDEQDRL